MVHPAYPPGVYDYSFPKEPLSVSRDVTRGRYWRKFTPLPGLFLLCHSTTSVCDW